MRFWKIHYGSLMRKSLAFGLLCVVFVVWKLLRSFDFASHAGTPLRSSMPFPVQNCRGMGRDYVGNRSDTPSVAFNESTPVEKNVLILTKRSSIIKTLIPVLEANRIAYDLHYLIAPDKDVLPSFTAENVGRYAGVIFTSFGDYFALRSWNKRLLDRYCRSYTVGMVLFNQGEGQTSQISDVFPFTVHTSIRQFKTYRVNKNATILRLVKADKVLESDERSDVKKWSLFIPENEETLKQFQVVSASSFNKRPVHDKSKNVTRTRFPKNPGDFPVVVHDLGNRDGVQRVYFGAGLTFWPHKLLFLDALGFVSRRKLEKPLDRWILVDIDDIFVGKEGIRMKKEDVKALVFTQRKLQKVVPGFHFNLGFSGKYFLHGSNEEDEGDRELLKNASEFWWFGHMWGHKQPHMCNTFEELQQQVQLNQDFAKEHGIPLDKSYSVAPHHSGVYPAYDVLYEGWNKVTGVKVTATEEYPHLKPAWKRRGFIYRNIMVLPRQTCGLFTHTLFLEQYPKGKDQLLKSIYGGELFQLFVSNPVNIFMTHLSNYGSDRLALYTFTNVIKFLQCWTNLQIMTVPPLELAGKYFKLFPSERAPIWQNPCRDPRHKLIWPAGKSCNRLPSFVIVGPQKTGTTALHMFLSVHPEILRNKDNEKTFEETQFFSSVNYYKGLDWYMDFFPDVDENSSTLVFEKSANYFDSSKAPMRAHALLPDAKIIVILNDPVRRAYSWFQHVRFHNSKVARSITFFDLLTYEKNSTDEVSRLRKRCLVPGLYAHHLERWMFYFPSSQILTIDGEQLRQDPVQVMEQVQTFIGVKTTIDYSTRLRYNEHKGFYCLTGVRCLGKSKGRKYPPMSEDADEYLRQYYREPNRQLVEFLHKIRQPLPKWLSTEVVGMS